MVEDKKDEIIIVEITEEFVKDRIYEIRGQKVLLDTDLAKIYGYFKSDFRLHDNQIETAFIDGALYERYGMGEDELNNRIYSEKGDIVYIYRYEDGNLKDIRITHGYNVELTLGEIELLAIWTFLKVYDRLIRPHEAHTWLWLISLYV